MLVRRHPRSVALATIIIALAVPLAGDRAGASTPAEPVDPATAVDAAGAGLRAYFDGLGELVYEGDDITVGECPLVASDQLTGALAPLDPEVELTPDDAEIEGLTEDGPEDGDVVVPVLVGCDFEDEDGTIEDVTVAAVDLSASEAVAWLEQFPTDDIAAIEADWSEEGALRGECRDESCLALWAGDDVAVIVLVDLDDSADEALQAVFGPVASDVIGSALVALAAHA